MTVTNPLQATWRDYKVLVAILLLILGCAALTVGGVLYNPPHQPTVIKYLNYTDGTEYFSITNTNVTLMISNMTVTIYTSGRGATVTGSP